jgi:4-diphosphocytidyl-2-C-methyl-D-erythritol kinase
MSCIDLSDDVEIQRLTSGPSRHEVVWAADAPRPTPIDWPIEKDLAVRAHRLLEAWAGRELPVAMRVVKRIPVGGGLGGGSSDAAAALIGLRMLFGLPVTCNDLRAMSANLGSDVAFFLDEAAFEGLPTQRLGPARSAIVGGLGDQLTRVAGIHGDLVLVIPGFGCPTGPVYKAFDSLAAGVGADESAVRRLAERAGLEGRISRSALFNDLAEPACVVQPELRTILVTLRQGTGRAWHVTGSGSCVFCVAESSGDAQTLLDGVRKILPIGAVALTTRLLSSAP